MKPGSKGELHDYTTKLWEWKDKEEPWQTANLYKNMEN